VRDAVSVTRSGDGASHGSALAWLTGHVGAPEVQYLQCGAEYCIAYSVVSALSFHAERATTVSATLHTCPEVCTRNPCPQALDRLRGCERHRRKAGRCAIRPGGRRRSGMPSVLGRSALRSASAACRRECSFAAAAASSGCSCHAMSSTSLARCVQERVASSSGEQQEAERH